MDATRSSAARRRSPQHGLAAQQRSDAADWDTGPELLSGADVLPEQFFSFPASCCLERPETALMRAVLANALACFQQGLMSGRQRVQRLAREAEAWVLSDDDRWPFSFVPICAALELEPAYIRREVKQWGQRSPLPTRGKLYRCVGVRRQMAA